MKRVSHQALAQHLSAIALWLAAAFMVALPMLSCSKATQPESYNYQRAMEAIENEDYEEALTYLQREVEENDKNANAYYWLASIYAEYEEYGQGLSAANKALKYVSANDKEMVASMHGLRARIYLEYGDTLRAISDMDAALKVEPDNEGVLAIKGDTYWKMGRYEESNACFLRLIELDESKASGHMGYGRNLAEQKKWKEAEEQFALAARLNGDFSQPFAFLAESQIEQKKWREAADNIITALAIDGNIKAIVLMLTDDDEFSALMVAKLKAMLVKEPEEDSWAFFIALILDNKGQYRKAAEMYKRGFEIAPSSALAGCVSNSYSSAGMWDKALEYNELAYSLDSTDTDCITNKADILYYSGDVKGAIAQMDLYVEREPDSYWGYYHRGWLEDNAKMVDEAIEDYSMSIALNGSYCYAYLGRADQYMKKGQTKLAMADYKRLARLDTIPQKGSCAFYAYAALGQRQKAVDYMDRYLASCPDKETYYEACCLYARMGENKTAINYLRTALEKGYRKFHHIATDDDMDSLREMPEFKALISEYKKKMEREQREPVETTRPSQPSQPTHARQSKNVTTEIPFTREQGNTCSVKCSINDLPLSFVFDTGASTVSLSQVEATFMMKNGYLSQQDVVGKHYYGDANGNVNEGTVINLKRVNFGGIELNNIKASVVKNQRAPLLLGQSVFQKFGKIEIDNDRKVLRVTR